MTKVKKAKYVLVGAKVSVDPAQNPGGQLTASIGLTEYARAQGYDLEIIDTTQPSFPVPRFNRRVSMGATRVARLFKILRAGGVNGVIVFAGSGFSFCERIVLSLICRLFHVPDLFFMRSGHFMNSVRSSDWSALYARLLLKVPFKIGVQGKKWIDFYKELGVAAERIVVIRNWLPESTDIVTNPKSAQSDHLLRFIFVGWLVRKKGIYELIKAISSLRLRYRFQCMLIGGGTLEAFVRQYIEDHGWGEDVKALGWKSKDEVRELLEAADVFVLPSHAEGFPNALLEAMAKGLPAICSDTGGISDSLKDGVNGFLIPPGECKPLAEAMERYLLDPELIGRHSLSTLSILRVNHDWESNCRRVFAVFSEPTKQSKKP